MQPNDPPKSPLLLTAEQVAWRLFEEARLTGWRTEGRSGLTPAPADESRYRAQDVEAYITTHLRAA